MSSRLTTDDLKEVRDLLYEVRRKWYDIGLELGLKVDELDTIKASYSEAQILDRLTEMLKKWLKLTTPQPTWEALELALRSKAVDEQELANEGKNTSSRVISITKLVYCHALSMH